MDQIITELRNELLSMADSRVKASGERYFKEPVVMYGIRSADVSAVGKEYFKRIRERSREEIFVLCEELWISGIMEESFIACHWSEYIHRQYQPGDFSIFDRWVNSYVNNWASCDTLCNHSVGSIVQMYPSLIQNLIGWTGSENRWAKRAAAVSLIIPARKGLFLKDIFRIADILHSDPDDMVQKGYGWMLKAASQANQEEVFLYVMSKKETMPRTALRYAIEKMSADFKAQAMAR
jgi:3-methyladenine DNA glycosylase AlkD